MALCFDFAAPTQRFAVFFLIINILVNKHSYFLALGFLTYVWVIRKLGLTSMNSSGVETISEYRR